MALVDYIAQNKFSNRFEQRFYFFCKNQYKLSLRKVDAQFVEGKVKRSYWHFLCTNLVVSYVLCFRCIIAKKIEDMLKKSFGTFESLEFLINNTLRNAIKQISVIKVHFDKVSAGCKKIGNYFINPSYTFIVTCLRNKK